MRVGFAGTPAFAATVLAAILAAGFEVPVVLTQPDRPRGRGMRVAGSAVKIFADAHALPIEQPPTLRDEAAQSALRARALDVLVVAAYGLILPPAVLAIPRRGCINVHASVLPRWRGAAPIERAILAGDSESGVTIMQMDAGLDTGPVHAIERTPIDGRETSGTLHDRLAALGARALAGVLARLANDGVLVPTPQPLEGATYAAKITRADVDVDWRASAAAIDRQVRAFDPAPGALTSREGEGVKIRAALPAAIASAEPGVVVAIDGEALVVGCGEGALRLIDVQPAGGRRMSGRSYAAGRRLAPGMRFDVTPAVATS